MSQPVEIREALPADGRQLVDAIARINEETEFLGEPGERVPWAACPEERIRALRAAAGGTYIVALSGGRVIGYIGACRGQFVRVRSVLLVPHFGVRRAYRAQGIGRRLLEGVQSWARETGAHRLELRVDEHNLAALSLYRSIGFDVEGRIVDAVRVNDRWRSQYWMGLRLGIRNEPRWTALDLPRPPAEDVGRVSIRAPRSTDASLVWSWERQLLAGSPFHLKLASEVASPAGIAATIDANVGNENDFQLAAFADASEIVGLVHAWVSPGARLRHDANFGLNVLPRWSGIGIGRKLASALDLWARNRGLRRLTTWVQAHNARGMRFARALGFERETVAREYLVIEGRAADRIGLARILR